LFAHGTHLFSQLHEFLATELIVAVLVETLEYLIRIRRATWTTTSPATPLATISLFGTFPSLGTCSIAFFFVEFAVSIGVELIDHLLAKLSSVGTSLLGVSFARRQTANQQCGY